MSRVRHGSAYALLVSLVVSSATSGCRERDEGPDAGRDTEAAVAGACAKREVIYPPDADFALDPDANADTIVLPECRATCGADELVGDGFPTIAALPAGSCRSSDDPCDMGAYVPCHCTTWTFEGPLNGYRCRCMKGRWECRVTSQGGGSCFPCDGGGAH